MLLYAWRRAHIQTRARAQAHTPNKIRIIMMIMLTHRSNVTACGERKIDHRVIVGKHISPGKCSTVPIPGIEV